MKVHFLKRVELNRFFFFFFGLHGCAMIVHSSIGYRSLSLTDRQCFCSKDRGSSGLQVMKLPPAWMAVFPHPVVVVSWTVCVLTRKGNGILNPNTDWRRVSLEAEDPEFLSKPKQRSKLFRFISLLGFANTLIRALQHTRCYFFCVCELSTYTIKVEMFTFLKALSCIPVSGVKNWPAL